MRLCSSKIYKHYRPIASKLFNIYVKEYVTIYGQNSISSNVHNLIHVVEDLQSCGADTLMEISTYKYENALRMIGLQMKHTNRPLEQVICRSIERDKIQSDSKFDTIQSIQFRPNFLREFKLGTDLFYKKIAIKPGVVLSNGRKSCNDAWFMTTLKEIVKFEYANKGSELLYGYKIKEKRAFFSSPLNSMKIDIYQCPNKLEDNLEAFSINCIQAKMMRISYNKDDLVFIPLVHSLD